MADSPKKKDPWWWKTFFKDSKRTLFTLGVSAVLIFTGLWHLLAIGAFLVFASAVLVNRIKIK